MTDGMFCANFLSQYQEILSKTRLFGTGIYSKQGRTLYTFCRRGIVVEWLERDDYGAESRRKVVSSRLDFAMRRLENSVSPAVNGYNLRIREG